ncbi:hypothetical protein HNR78_000118 [Parageobacillus toebii NBRC 107807]|uniref:Uncharacterized protein n=1 Tax=Parageobacillus toebii NBRC 107807 TaxID=1223503 RepID=A0AA89NKL3_9BACL|nr:hypothetical protein [Parageobacillus toebii NBRC 107807]
MKEDDNLISSVKVAGREEARGKGGVGPYSMTKSTQLKT